MAKLEKLSSNSWKQLFKDRQREFCLWSSQKEVAEYCTLMDGTKRHINVEFENHLDLNITDWFQITSGGEIRFPRNLQEIVSPIIKDNPDSYFIATILDTVPEDATAQSFSTTGTATVDVRIGQDKFRKKLIEYWKGCSVTKVKLIEVLKASHIKPWAKSSDEERLDRDNGLLLNPMLDTLFDKGYISFKDNGQIIISTAQKRQLLKLGVDKDLKLSKIEHGHIKYLEYHRLNIYRS
jgi:putative restriction endonuclease